MVLYTLGKQGKDNPINVGDAPPIVSAIDNNKKTFASAELAGNPVLIKFFRGHW